MGLSGCGAWDFSTGVESFGWYTRTVALNDVTPELQSKLKH